MRKILIVDDDELTLKILKFSLGRFYPDISIETASDGETALMKIHQENFALVITDYFMGEMDGIKLVESIHKAQPDMKVVLTTACALKYLEKEPKTLQVFRLLSKPVDLKAFRQILDEVLDKRTTQQEGLYENSGTIRGASVSLNVI
jgi:DNA-binding NtrC family response regulator